MDKAPIVFSLRAIFTMISIILSAVLFLGQIYFHVFICISPIQYIRASRGTKSNKRHNSVEDITSMMIR